METDYSLQFHLIREKQDRFFRFHNPAETKRLAVSSTYGYLAIGDTEGAINIALTDIFEQRQYRKSEKNNFGPEGRVYAGYYNKICTPKLGFNSNGRVLAVDTLTGQNGSFIHFFDAAVLAPTSNVDRYALTKMKLADAVPGQKIPGKWEQRQAGYIPIKLKRLITMLEWNPVNPHMLAAATDETLFIILFDLEDALNHRILAKMDMETPITAFSWNPAGTQLTVGDADGRIHQFNPQLKSILTVNPPDLIPSVFPDKFACSGICWVSKTERIVVFSSETSDKLHLTKLTVKPNKPPKWTVWDVLPAAESIEFDKTFNFLPIFKWNIVLMSSSCLTEVFTFGIVNKVWKPLKLDDRFTIKTPLHKSQKTFITSMSINYSSQKNVIIDSEFSNMPPQPVVYLSTTHDMTLIYHLVSLDSNRPSLFKPAQSIDKDNMKNGNGPSNSGDGFTDSDSDVRETIYFSEHGDSSSDEGGDNICSFFHNYRCYTFEKNRDNNGGKNKKAKTDVPVVYTRRKGINTGVATKDVDIQVNLDHDGTSDETTILKLRGEVSRLKESILRTKEQRAKATCLRLRAMGKLSAAGILEVYIAENDKSSKVMDIGNRWAAMHRSDTKLISEMKRLDCKLSVYEFVAAVLSILDKPESKALSLDPENGIGIKDSVFSETEKTALEAVCSAMTCKFVIV